MTVDVAARLGKAVPRWPTPRPMSTPAVPWVPECGPDLARRPDRRAVPTEDGLTWPRWTDCAGLVAAGAAEEALRIERAGNGCARIGGVVSRQRRSRFRGAALFYGAAVAEAV